MTVQEVAMQAYGSRGSLLIEMIEDPSRARRSSIDPSHDVGGIAWTPLIRQNSFAFGHRAGVCSKFPAPVRKKKPPAPLEIFMSPRRWPRPIRDQLALSNHRYPYSHLTCFVVAYVESSSLTARG